MKWIIALIILAMAGIGYYVYTEFANPYGIEPGHPLGKLEKIEKTLTGLSLVRLSSKDYRAPLTYIPKEEAAMCTMGQVASVVTYGDMEETERRRTGDVLQIMLDKEGKVRAIAAKFLSGPAAQRQTFISAMMLRQWNLHAGSDEPAFSEANGLDRIGRFSRGPTEGVWYWLLARDKTYEMVIRAK